MKTITKKLILVSLTFMLVFGMTTLAVASTTPRVSINGEYVQLGEAPVIENGRTLLPVRFVVEAMGANVKWNAPTSEATISNNYATIVLTIGSNEMVVTRDGTTDTVVLDVAPQIINNRTFVHIYDVIEALGATVNSAGSTISISFVGDVAVQPTPPTVAETPAEAETPTAPSTNDIIDVIDFYRDLLEMQLAVSNELSSSTDFTNLLERMDALTEIAALISDTDYQSIDSMRVKANGLADIAARFGIDIDAFRHLL